MGAMGDTRGVQMSTIGAQGGRVQGQQGTQRVEHMDTREQKGIQMSTRGYTGCKREHSSLFIVETSKSYKLNLRSHTGKGFTTQGLPD